MENNPNHLGITFRDWVAIPLIAIPVLLIVVYFFTRQPAYNWYDISESGTVGDAIGGITAPFINLLGAVLVYVAFKAQNRANRAQWNAIEKESRIETNRQIEALLQEVTKELDSLEITYEEKVWVLDAKTNRYIYHPNGGKKTGISTVAIDYATILLQNHKLWNTVHTDPQGKVSKYYNLDPHRLHHLYSRLRYIQISFRVATTLLSSLKDYSEDPIFIRSQAFYNSKLGVSLMLFGEALSKASEEYKLKASDFIADQEYIDNFFDAVEGIDSSILDINKSQKNYFLEVLQGK